MSSLDDTNDTAPLAPAPVRPMYWSIQRELWENRFLYIAPLIITAVVLFGSAITLITLPYRMPNASDSRLHELALKPLETAPAPIMLTTILIGMFYCLDALYGERRDRSILFWKSLPVSDRTTVLSKVSIPLIVMPLIAYALSVLTQIVLIPLAASALIGKGVDAGAFGGFKFFERLVVMFYGLTVHALWFAPIQGALLLISAWAKRATFLWAVLPLVGVAALERILFNTSYFLSFLQYRITGAMKEAFAFDSANHSDIEALLTPARFLSSPGLWIGLAVAAACIATAVRLRQRREPI